MIGLFLFSIVWLILVFYLLGVISFDILCNFVTWIYRRFRNPPEEAQNNISVVLARGIGSENDPAARIVRGIVLSENQESSETHEYETECTNYEN